MKNNAYTYNLGQLFSKVAEENANEIAIKTIEGNHFAYQELEVLSNKLAHFLLTENLQKGDVIAVLNNKTAFSYAIMLACLKTGIIYTNLDPKSPVERFSKMIDKCEPKVLFYNNTINTQPVITQFETSKIKTVDYGHSEIIEYVNTLSPEFPIENNYVTTASPAYIMFTSGSTGFPKGVLITHANLMNFIKWTKNVYNTTTKDVFTNLNPMHFDNSVFDFYASLFTGASLVPINEHLTINPRKLLDALNKVAPTIWFSVPSLLVYVLNMRALKEKDLQRLRVVTYGGEGFPKNQLRSLWKKWGHRVRFVNVYGPTECTCICSSYDVSEKDIESDELLPLGPIAPNFYALILDEDNQPVEDGQIGELHIGGPNVGLGYFNNTEKTTEVFIQNPFISSHSEIIYKSGDMVSYSSEKNLLYFKGRKDNQIKRMGYRIELEEIENALNSFEYIKESAVIYIDNENNKAKIIACITNDSADEDQIKEDLKKFLPLYMMPDIFKFYEILPKNQNGKINRLELKTILEKLSN